MPLRRLSFLEKLRLLWLAFIDKRTPTFAKVIVILGLLYGISPIDLIPDVVPVVGLVDDLGVLIFVLVLFLRMTRFVRRELQEIGDAKRRVTATKLSQ